MIEFQDISYRYPTATEDALSGINLHIPEGQFCAVVGPSGAGKSTLGYAASGFVPHFFKGDMRGEVTLGGISVAMMDLGELSARVGMVFQNPFNQISGARFTVREEIAFGLENLGLARGEMAVRIDEALRITGLQEEAERSPLALSGGQQQRVALASMFAMQPAVLVLDEPTSQLDPRGTQEVFAAIDALAQAGSTILITEHKLEWLAAYADRAVLLNQGRILADGAPSEVFASEAMVEVGVGRTRFTEAAAAVRAAGLLRGKASLPITLSEAEAYLA